MQVKTNINQTMDQFKFVNPFIDDDKFEKLHNKIYNLINDCLINFNVTCWSVSNGGYIIISNSTYDNMAQLTVFDDNNQPMSHMTQENKNDHEFIERLMINHVTLFDYK